MINKFYTAPSGDSWSGRQDPDGKRFHETIRMQDITSTSWSADKNDIVILGFCSDEGVARNKGRRGAFHGPSSFRKKLGSLAHHHQDRMKVWDGGDISCSDGDLEGAQKALGQGVAKIISQGGRPFVIGGGHEVAWGHYLGYRNHPAFDSLGIINFDAHLDMRPITNIGPSSGTPFLQVALDRKDQKLPFQYSCLGLQPQANHSGLMATAQEYGVHIVEATDLFTTTNHKKIVDQCIPEGTAGIYLTICLDVFATSIAPGVSAPQPFGLFSHHVLPVIKKIASSGKLVGFDIAELAPALDDKDQTAALAAALFNYTATHWTL